MGPLDTDRPWATKDVIGAHRFLQRLWRNLIDETTGELRVVDAELDPDVPTDRDTLRALHRAIAGVCEDYAALRLNTAIAKLIELNNHVTKVYGARAGTPRIVAETLVLLLAPVAPHVAEELWSRLGHGESLAHGPMPQADERYLVEDTVEYPIQINGKVRTRMTVPTSASPDEVRAAALAQARLATLVTDEEPRKVIVVPDRLVNIVV
jgi:leucyl-tRNA synthetase